MGAQFGRWNFDGGRSSSEYIGKVAELMAPYGPDGVNSHLDGGATILHFPFHTTKESRGAAQPFVAPSGAVVVWDGRLDNRTELLKQLPPTISEDAPDVRIVAAAYDAFGTECLAKLVGDWALSIWSSKDACLLLAKDPIGTRHLYYSLDAHCISWSSVIDPLVRFAGHSLRLSREYLAGWLSLFPPTRLTPYDEIYSVPPACFVRVANGTSWTTKYWDFDPGNRIRYSCDAEYEEHFRTVFRNSVRRRLCSSSPILAELSGGMDSASIVCMADAIIADGRGETPRLDTVSYFDNSEPNWNEAPYFTKVEQKRGHEGFHINVGPKNRTELVRNWFGFTPTSASRVTEATNQFADWVKSHRNLVLLSGIGGDEVLGGRPTPVPELADLLVQHQLKALTRQLRVWALQLRQPLLHILTDVLREFLPHVLANRSRLQRVAPWLTGGICIRDARKLERQRERLRWRGALPSFQSSLRTLDLLRRQLACDTQSINPRLETRYCYLDRDLLEFLYAIPREQLVRPGQRRSLVRRALAGIVPAEVLGRKRKAFVARSAVVTVAEEWAGMCGHRKEMVSHALGIVNQQIFSEAIKSAENGLDVSTVLLARTLTIESWLRHLLGCDVKFHISAGE